VQAALGDVEINKQSCQQLWMHLARKWRDDPSRTLSPTAKQIQTCLCKITNVQGWRLSEPSDFSIMDQVEFCG